MSLHAQGGFVITWRRRGSLGGAVCWCWGKCSGAPPLAGTAGWAVFAGAGGGPVLLPVGALGVFGHAGGGSAAGACASVACGMARHRAPGGPGRRASWRSGARPPAGGRPHRGRPASPASPSRLNRPIQRRTVAGWHSSSPAICAADNPCSDSSTITARAACRHRPRRSARNRSISLPGPLANTQTGRILTTTSPGGRTMEATSIQPPARLMSTPAHPAAASPPVTRKTSG